METTHQSPKPPSKESRLPEEQVGEKPKADSTKGLKGFRNSEVKTANENWSPHNQPAAEKVANREAANLKDSENPSSAAFNPGEGFSKVIKVIQLSPGEDSKADSKVVATIQFSQLPPSAKLGNIRENLGEKIDASQQFCYIDGSTESDSLGLATYFEHIDETGHGESPNIEGSTSKPLLLRKIYLTTSVAPKAEKPRLDSILSKDVFVISISEWENQAETKATEVTGLLKSRGTLHSKAFTDGKPSEITLAGLRRKLSAVSSMSTSSTVHIFCTSKGISVSDETITFADYLKLEEKDAPEKSDIPSVMVVYKANSWRNQPTVSVENMPGKIEPHKPVDMENMFKSEKKSTVNNGIGADRGFAYNIPSSGWDGSMADCAGDLTPEKWQVVIENCGLLHGWIVDRQNNRIIRAPRPAFKLRARENDDPIALIPDFFREVEVTSDKTAVKPKDNVKPENGAVIGKEGPVGQSAGLVGVQDPYKTASQEEVSKTKPIRRPRFIVNDDSKIEVTLSAHEFETSMAKNDFSSQSTEGAVTGGYAGFSTTVTAGYSSKKSSSSVATSNTYKKTLVAKYLFPRCDIMLNAEDLEPTEDLKAALKRFAQTKNINELRQLYKDYGQLFCQKVTVGGRLQSTRIMDTTTNKSEQEHKEAFKVSVGIQVSTPIGVGGGVKHENEEGKSESKASSESKTNESNVFEAVGGQTILAADPAAWSKTVSQHQNWRVINRDRLTTMVDLMSTLPGYAAVKRLFAQAIPTLSKYIEFDAAREVTVRLRLMSPTTQLSHSFMKTEELEKKHQTRPDPMYYLGHSPFSKVTPTLRGIKNVKFLWDDLVEYPVAQSLFTPRSYRAPAIMGYVSDGVGHAGLYDQNFTDTLWSIVSPFNEALKHGNKVIIRTKPMEVMSKNEGHGSANPTPSSTTESNCMIVFRNAQGVFLPGMTGSDDSQYWRVLKLGAQKPDEYIKEGDEIRLAWAFKDQTTGFRDFLGDIYGRRRNQMPADLENDVLYLKLPWPRFESLKAPGPGQSPMPNAMLLSTLPPQDLALTELTTVPALASLSLGGNGKSLYAVQDLFFRIDTVLNGGRGDSDDYLLKGLSQSAGVEDGKDAKKAGENLKELEAHQKACYEMFFLENQR